MEEATAGVPDRESVRQARGWKLLLLIPRQLLHRPPGGARIPKRKLLVQLGELSSARQALEGAALAEGD